MKKINGLFIILSLLASNWSSAKENLKAKTAHSDVALLAPTSIFKPLLADPKYPRFSIAYYHYNEGEFKYNTMAPNFGAALPLVRWFGDGNDLEYELGLHAGLFAAMDIRSTPTRLINADYFIGPTLAIKNDKWDYLLRVTHTSSHIGDELLLSKDGKRRNIKRINLSYETAEGIVAYNFANGFRPYMGVGYIVHAEPTSYKTAEVIAGFDYRHPEYYLKGYAKPIFAVYSKTSRNFNWKPSLSVKTGVEFKDRFVIGKQLQVFLEYYNGNSIQGQFYKSRESYVGLSLNLNF